MAEISNEERKRLKGLGFLSNNDGVHFSMRVLSGNGVLTGAELRTLGEAAERFGNGTVSLTTRLTVELPGISYENTEAVGAFIAQAGLLHGGTGPKVRPVVACKGTYCTFGLCDTQAIALEIHNRFYLGYHDVTLPHKFKIAVGGCPNNCVKPDLNDFGVAARIQGGKRGFRVYLGGRWGKATRHGSLLNAFYETPEQIYELLEKVILLYRANAYRGERLALMIDRIGMDTVEQLLESDLLGRKAEILAAPLCEPPNN